MVPKQDAQLNLLSLDGGGVRGVSELVILDHVMRRLQEKADLDDLPRPCDYFDLIAGTSTGGLVAIMLGRLQMTTREALETYDQVAGDIFGFQNRKPKVPHYKASSLVKAVKGMVTKYTDTDLMIHPGLANRKGKAFVCSAVPDEQGAAQRFRTYAVDDEADEWLKDCKIWEAARATSAAPLYFKEMIIQRGLTTKRFVDGAIGYNNPTEELIDEAGRLFNRKRKLGAIVSLGTGTKPKNLYSSEDVGFPPYAWSMFKTLKDNTVDTEGVHRRVQTKLKDYPSTYFRFNVPKAAEKVSLAEYDKMGMLKEMTSTYLELEMVKQEVEDLVDVLMKKTTTGITIGHIVLDKKEIPDDSCIARNMSPPSDKFVGRKEILYRLDDYFAPRTVQHKFRREFLLCGMGGAGKTQIALKFAQDYGERFKYIFFVDAENLATAQQSFRDIAITEMGQEVKDDEPMDKVRKWISSLKDEWLLLLDNCTADHRRKIAPVGNKGNIIYTSRDHSLGLSLPPESVAVVEDLNQEDAITLVLRAAHMIPTSIPDREEAEPLVKELGCLALAVDQAGSYIHMQHSTLGQYLERFRKRRAELLSDDRYKGADTRSQAVYATFDISYQAVKDISHENRDFVEGDDALNALKILEIICFYHNERVPGEMFRRAAVRRRLKMDKGISHPLIGGKVSFDHLLYVDDHGNWDDRPFLFATQLLEEYSLVKIDGWDVSMHVLIHSWARDRMDVKRLMQRAFLAKSLFCWSIPEQQTKPSHYAYRRRLFPHATAMVEYLNEHKETYTKFGQLDDILESELELRLGFLFQEAGEFDSAERAYNTAFFLRKCEHGADSPLAHKLLWELNSLYMRQTRYGEAERVLLEILERMERPEPISVKVRPKSPSEGLKKAFPTPERSTKDNTTDTSDEDTGGAVIPNQSPKEDHENSDEDRRYYGVSAKVLARLADVYAAQGLFDVAERSQIKAIQRRKQNLKTNDENHPEIFRMKKDLDYIRSMMGGPGRNRSPEEQQAAIEESQALLDEYLAKCDPLDVRVLAIKSCLATQLKSADRLEEADLLFEQHALGCAEVYGPRDLRTLAAFRDYGEIKEAQMAMFAAEEVQRLVLGKVIGRSGQQDPEAAFTLLPLGRAISSQGRFDEGIVLMAKSVELHKATFGAQHYRVKGATDSLEEMVRIASTRTPELRRALARNSLPGGELLTRDQLDSMTLTRQWNFPTADGGERHERVYLSSEELAATGTSFANLLDPQSETLTQSIEMLNSAVFESVGGGMSGSVAEGFV